MKTHDEETRFQWVTISTILAVFAAAAVIVGYAFFRSGEHYEHTPPTHTSEPATPQAPH